MRVAAQIRVRVSGAPIQSTAGSPFYPAGPDTESFQRTGGAKRVGTFDCGCSEIGLNRQKNRKADRGPITELECCVHAVPGKRRRGPPARHRAASCPDPFGSWILPPGPNPFRITVHSKNPYPML